MSAELDRLTAKIREVVSEALRTEGRPVDGVLLRFDQQPNNGACWWCAPVMQGGTSIYGGSVVGIGDSAEGAAMALLGHVIQHARTEIAMGLHRKALDIEYQSSALRAKARHLENVCDSAENDAREGTP